MNIAGVRGKISQCPLRDLAPRFGVPGLETFWGAFVDLLQILYDIFADTIDLGAGPGVGSPSPAPSSSLERPRGIPM
jgi:hypothetical protein